MDEKLYYLLIGTFLGWLLGLLSPVISSFISRSYQKSEIKTGIYNELNEVKLRMVMVVNVLSPCFTPLCREHLMWSQPHLEEYDRLYPGSNLAERNKKFLELNDDQINTIAAKEISEERERRHHIKAYSLPFLESHTGSLAIFDAEFQRRLIEIRTQISFLNEEISQSRFYFEKTFDNISLENYKIIDHNLSESYRNIAKLLRRLVDNIDKFIDP